MDWVIRNLYWIIVAWIAACVVGVWHLGRPGRVPHGRRQAGVSMGCPRCSVGTHLVWIVYGFIVPDALHMTGVLEQVLPVYRWLTPTGFGIGLVESFLYGAR